MATPRECSTLLNFHWRRDLTLRNAWFGSAGAAEAWAALGYRKPNDLDAGAFEEMVADDVATHGAPATIEEFVEHYNRMLERRTRYFRQNYVIKALLGMGGFSRVVRAEHVGGKQMVALKCSIKNFEEGRTLELLEEEMRIWSMSELIHPGLVQLLGVYELPEAIILVTELCDGGCLMDALEVVETMNEASVRTIGKQVVDALLHLHLVAKVAHRDIKPENVLCTSRSPHVEGRVLLSDFGLAATLQAGGGLTKLVGTPDYLAPEMISALKTRRKSLETGSALPDATYDERVDLWALGVLLYELFTGFPPFDADDDEALFQMILEAPLAFPEVPFASCSPECTELLRRLLERDPERRISGDELRAAVDAWLSSDIPSTEAFSSRPRHATETSLKRGAILKVASLATTACVRFSIEGRSAAAKYIQSTFRYQQRGGHGSAAARLRESAERVSAELSFIKRASDVANDLSPFGMRAEAT